MISIRNLSVKFGVTEALKNVSIDFDQLKIHGIVGLNGSGKTTLFNVMAKTLKPGAGTVTINNVGVKIIDIAYLETVNYFFSGITGSEYLKIFKQTNSDFSLDIFQHYFRLPLTELIENYSTGMKKKLALLGILKQDKPIYIFDEPFNGLDLESNKILEIIIGALRGKNRTVFISSHILDPLISTCDVIHLLQNGSFIKTYTKADFNKIDEDLFGKLKYEATEKISKAI